MRSPWGQSLISGKAQCCLPFFIFGPQTEAASLFPRSTVRSPLLQKVRELPVPGASKGPDGHGLLKYLATAGVLVGAGLIALAVRRQTRRGVGGKHVGPEAPRYRKHGYDDDGGGKKGGKRTTTVEGIKVAKEDAGVVERHLAMGEGRQSWLLRRAFSDFRVGTLWIQDQSGQKQ